MWCLHRTLPTFHWHASQPLTPPPPLQRDERSVVLWSYHLEHIIPLCKDFEEKLIKHIWRTRDIARKPLPNSTVVYTSHSRGGSRAEINEKTDINRDVERPDGVNKEEGTEPHQSPSPPRRRSFWNWWRLQPRAKTSAGSEEGGDPEKSKNEKRKLVLIGPLYAGCGVGLAGCKSC